MIHYGIQHGHGYPLLGWAAVLVIMALLARALRGPIKHSPDE